MSFACSQTSFCLKQLEKDFTGQNIVFLSLSVDKDTSAWKKMVSSSNLTKMQWHLSSDSSFLRDYRVNGIPRFIFLDPAGRIINADMTRPSSSDIHSILDGFLK